MNFRLIFAFGAAAIAASAPWPLRAEEPAVERSAASPVFEESSARKEAAEASEAAPVDVKSAAEAAPPSEIMPARQAETSPARETAAETDAAPVQAEPAAMTPEAETPLPTPAAAEPPRPEETPAVEASAPPPAPEIAAPRIAAEPPLTRLDIPPALTAEAEALKRALLALPEGSSDEEHNERAALLSFYEGRAYAPLWLDAQAHFTPKGAAAVAEIKRAREWGLEPGDFALPAEASGAASAEAAAAAEIKASLAVLKYARYARGGRIINPSEQLSSYLDRRPQLLKPATVLEGIAETNQPDIYLRGLHPSHPQFERLRQKYVALLERGKQQSAEAKKLLANMEQWRWMPLDMGDVYVWNNIPEYTQRVVTKGEIVRKERIVAGQIDKQTPIFTRPLRKITFKPTWIVPDSIKVRELWPNMLRGGSLMREWGLEVLKDGEPVNWHRIDWSQADIRTYDVIQPNGPKSVMGKVKFSFPSQHTVFMHDALERDKWMFKAAQRTYSHGCMRVQNPINLAEILLREDKGWDFATTRHRLNTGPNNDEIPIERKIFVHITYFTALVDDDGKLHTFPDVYGHERRVTLALEGKWNQIVKGRDHLAPVELDLASAHPRHYAADEYAEAPGWRRGASYGYRGGFLDSLFSGR